MVTDERFEPPAAIRPATAADRRLALAAAGTSRQTTERLRG
jgi:hypothetical protein